MRGFTRRDLPNGRTVYICETCDRPVSKGSLSLHAAAHQAEELMKDHRA